MKFGINIRVSYLIQLLLIISTIGLTGCDSSDKDKPDADTDTDTDTDEPVAILATAFNLIDISSANTSNADGSGAIHHMALTWETATAEAGTTGITYTVCVADDAEENGCSPLGEVTDALTMTVQVDSLIEASSQDFFILANYDNETVSSSEASLSSESLTEMIGYFKASDANTYDNFGAGVAVSNDGNTVVVSSEFMDSDELTNNGAVYVFSFDEGKWSQTAILEASNAYSYDRFGASLAISSDGMTIAVGATGEDSSVFGINGDEANNFASDAGAVYVFTLDGEIWNQGAYIKASNTGAGDSFGDSVALSEDGSVLAVGASYETLML